MKIALLTFIHLFSKNKKETEIMKKICILICMVCLSLCLFSGSMDAMTVNATENSIENEIQQAYLEAIEAQNKRNNELELLIDKVDESWLIEDENGKMSWAITEEEKENIDVELVSFLDQSIKEKNELIDDSIIVQSDGEILLTEEAEDDYFIQSGDFYVVQKYKKVWFATIWIGFDVIANNPSAAHGIDIINNASKGRGTTFHYTVLFYSGYTLH